MSNVDLKNCPICGKETIFFPNNDVLLKCLNCEIVFYDPDKIEKLDYYENKEVINVDEKTIKARKRNVKQRIKLIRKILSKESVLLDIGCGEGLFLQEVKNYVNRVYGIEPNKSYVAYAKEKMNLEIIQGGVEDVEFPKESFDIITLFHVLEHLTSPSYALTKIYSWLKKKGYIVIEVPNIECPYAKYKGLNWELIYPEHRFYFSPNSLKYLLKKNNFEIVSVKFRDFDQYRTGIGKNLRKLGIKIAKQERKKHLADKKSNTSNLLLKKGSISILKRIRGVLQLPIKALLGFLVKTFKKSDYLFIIAKKVG